MVRRSSSLCLLHSLMVLIIHWKIITIFHYFDKFYIVILVIINYHTIILFVDVDTQISNKKKIPHDLDPITSLSTIICSKYSFVAIPLIPLILVLGDLHWLSIYLRTPNFVCAQSLSNNTKESQLLTLPYEPLILDLTKFFLGVY